MLKPELYPNLHPNLNMVTWFLYLLECNNGAYYAGITNDLQARFETHLAGKGARYTRANPPVKWSPQNHTQTVQAPALQKRN